jgi:lipoate-protein ligase A
MSGAANMAYDRQTLETLQNPDHSPVLRFFRWDKPAATCGKHQNLSDISTKIPAGYEAVQRPTGGGIVLHGDDLCVSLCWRAGQPPLPTRLKDHYAWIHNVLVQALIPTGDARLANCRECATVSPFAIRDCFNEPVVFDVLRNGRKIAGGALCRQKDVFLYQGSIQGADPDLEARLKTVFLHAFSQS